MSHELHQILCPNYRDHELLLPLLMTYTEPNYISIFDEFKSSYIICTKIQPRLFYFVCTHHWWICSQFNLVINVRISLVGICRCNLQKDSINCTILFVCQHILIDYSMYGWAKICPHVTCTKILTCYSLVICLCTLHWWACMHPNFSFTGIGCPCWHHQFICLT